MIDKIRVVLDTNLWISCLISKSLKRIDQLLFAEKVVLLFSEESLGEFIEVAYRPKFRIDMKFFASTKIVTYHQFEQETSL